MKDEKLNQAVMAVKAGDKRQGKALIAEILKNDQGNEQAWLLMARVVESNDERVRCIQNVLKINPDNEVAKRGLAKFQQLVANQSQPIETPVEAAKQQSDQTSSPLQRFLSEQQDPIVTQQVHQRVSEILTSDEKIFYIAVQKPLISLSPDSVALTNRRFIIYKPKLLGGVTFEDYIWRDLSDVQLKEGMINSTLSFRIKVKRGPTALHRKILVEHLPKAQARKLYAFAQEREEQVREERRTRAMEEKRAAAGGVIIQGAQNIPDSASPSVSASANDDPLEKLTKLKAMLDAELITQKEYDEKKTDLLSKM